MGDNQAVISESTYARLEAEKILLAGLLVAGADGTPESIKDVAKVISPNDFIDFGFPDNRHSRIYEAMLKGKSDQLSVAVQLNTSGNLQGGDIGYLSDLIASCEGIDCTDSANALREFINHPQPPAQAGSVFNLMDITEYNLTDAGNAEYFTNQFGDNLRYDHRRGRWFEWHTHYWKPENDGHIMRLALKAARGRYKAAVNVVDLEQREKIAKGAIQSEQRARLEACIAIAGSLKPIADSGEHWDTDGWLFCVENGVIELRTAKLRPGRQTDLITMQAPVVYDAEATAPRWLQFLDEIFSGDTELIDWLQLYLGYSLTGDTREQTVAIPYGKGANGKTRLLSILRHVMGDYAYDAPFSTFELTQRAAIPNDLAALVGKRLVTSSETNEGTRLNEARIKALSGQDSITARFLHAEFFTFEPVAKFFLSVNHRPRVQDDSYGFWRRVRLIPLNREFKGEFDDKLLLDKLIAELSGILNWLLAGCLKWQRQGLEPTPDCVMRATEEYRTESDPLSEFLLDQCGFSPQAQVKASHFYKAYLSWCDNQGMRERERMTNSAFGRRMGQKFKKDHDRAGTFYQGVGLKCDGFVTGFEPNDKNSDVFPNFHSHVGNNIETPSQPATSLNNPSQELVESPDSPDYPTHPCYNCGDGTYFLTDDNRWLCVKCHPGPEGPNHEK